MQSYEEARWPHLSPARRDAVNRLRQARGQETIPPPKVDLYTPRPTSKIVPIDPNDPELIREIRAAGMMLGLRGDEGFEIRSAPGGDMAQRPRGFDAADEGFEIR